MRLVRYVGPLAVGAIAMLAGCEPNQLYLGSRTVVGINASVNPELSSGSLVVGYDRMFATVIPVVQNDQPQEAMTSIACSSLLVKGVTIKRFTESIATGPAAAKFAGALSENYPQPVKDFFDCFKKTKGVTKVTVEPVTVGSQ